MIHFGSHGRGKNKSKILFQIDESDYEAVSHYKWYYSKNTRYMMTTINYYPMFLHVFLGGRAPNGYMWDHKDRDRSNYQRNNLRLVTPTENARNRNRIIKRKIPKKSNRTMRTGVYKVPTGYLALIYVDKQNKRLGIFNDYFDAVRARREAELKYWK